MTPDSVLPFAVVALAVFRVARLVAADTITEPIRAAVDDRATGNDEKDRSERAELAWWWLGALIGCQWCVSIWAGIPMAAAVLLAGDRLAVLVLAYGLAASAVAGIVGQVIEVLWKLSRSLDAWRELAAERRRLAEMERVAYEEARAAANLPPA